MIYLLANRDEYYMIAAGKFVALRQGIQEKQVVLAQHHQESLTNARA